MLTTTASADPTDHTDSIAILDCGGQYTKVIDRKVRELGVRSEIFPIDVPPQDLAGFDGVILSGGPASVWGEDPPDCHPGLWELELPVLGICYGMQLLNARFGGTVAAGVSGGEYGVTDVRLDPSVSLFDGLSETERVLMSHGDSVEKIAPGFRVVAETDDAVGALADPDRRLYGVQFHPEVDLTEHGRRMLENFLRKVCGLAGNYVLEDRVETALAAIRETVGEHRVLVLVSGGVDSAVSAALLVRALGPEKVHAVHIDHGLMRKDESDRICESLSELGLEHLTRIDGEAMFFGQTVEIDGRQVGPLTTLTDPEEKRQLIGEVFLRALRQAAEGLELDLDDTFWAQGTLRPDLIESGNPGVSGFAQKIKTHHNDIELVRRAREKGLVIETNRDWHKDEVRQVGGLLGLPAEITQRQPFPGPGLAVRLIADDGRGSVTSAQVDAVAQLAREADPELGATVVPVRTVGVQGDQRSYRNLALVDHGRAGITLDEVDWDLLMRLGNRLANRLDFVNRTGFVLAATGGEGAATLAGLEVTPTHVTPETAELLRQLDAIVTEHLTLPTLGQSFAVLLPVGRDGKRSVAVRTFVTEDYMTGRPGRPGTDFPEGVLERVASAIVTGFGDDIDLVVYDVTSKPPATVEWE